MRDQCYGIIPLQQTKEGLEVLLVKHAKGHWDFPKGHEEEGDANVLATAKRELLEETNLDIDTFLSLSPIVEKYSFIDPKRGKVDKQVDYYLALVKGTLQVDEEEIVEARFIPIQEAMDLMTYPTGKEVCQKAIIYLLKQSLNEKSNI